MFKYCKTNDEFHRIVNNKGHIHIRNDTATTTTTTTTTTTMYYKYTKEDFQEAMHALHDYLFDSSSTNINPYKVKRFENKDEKCRGHMMCFPYYTSIQFAELRIIGEVKDSDGESISDCRFVYAYFENNDIDGHGSPWYKGVLFLTTSHYGWYLVPPVAILDKLLSLDPFNLNINEHPFSNWSYHQKYREFTNLKTYQNFYKRQEHVIAICKFNGTEIFPFENLGTITLKSDNNEFELIATI